MSLKLMIIYVLGVRAMGEKIFTNRVDSHIPDPMRCDEIVELVEINADYFSEEEKCKLRQVLGLTIIE